MAAYRPLLLALASTMPACATHQWYPGAGIVATVQIARSIHDVRMANEAERRAAAEREAHYREGERRREAARRRLLEQELATTTTTTTSSAPAAPVDPFAEPVPTRKQLATQRALVRAQAGAAGPAQSFARSVIALAGEPGSFTASELADLASEAAGYLQATLASAAVRRTDSPAWRDETRTSFCLIGQLPRTGDVDAALVRGCKSARPAVPGEQVPAFVAECRARAGGDATRLQWDGVKDDLGRAAQVDAAGARPHCT